MAIKNLLKLLAKRGFLHLRSKRLPIYISDALQKKVTAENKSWEFAPALRAASRKSASLKQQSKSGKAFGAYNAFYGPALNANWSL